MTTRGLTRILVVVFSVFVFLKHGDVVLAWMAVTSHHNAGYGHVSPALFSRFSTGAAFTPHLRSLLHWHKKIPQRRLLFRSSLRRTFVYEHSIQFVGQEFVEYVPFSSRKGTELGYYTPNRTVSNVLCLGEVYLKFYVRITVCALRWNGRSVRKALLFQNFDNGRRERSVDGFGRTAFRLEA
jgi:hypothetical protein